VAQEGTTELEGQSILSLCADEEDLLLFSMRAFSLYLPSAFVLSHQYLLKK
jgi:hypothetical protein